MARYVNLVRREWMVEGMTGERPAEHGPRQAKPTPAKLAKGQLWSSQQMGRANCGESHLSATLSLSHHTQPRHTRLTPPATSDQRAPHPSPNNASSPSTHAHACPSPAQRQSHNVALHTHISRQLITIVYPRHGPHPPRACPRAHIPQPSPVFCTTTTNYHRHCHCHTPPLPPPVLLCPALPYPHPYPHPHHGQRVSVAAWLSNMVLRAPGMLPRLHGPLSPCTTAALLHTCPPD